MKPFWRTVIRRLLLVFDAPVIIEIGAAAGKMTEQLLSFSLRQNGVVHVIDPAPTFDVSDLAERFGPCMQFHQACSHDVLDEIEPANAVLIDGDHNWYTVHGELERLEAIAHRHDRSFPLVMLHDVDWPYARRDLYYNPDTIPTPSRHAWARRGIIKGQSQLSETSGINRGLANALEEGGPRNGVLTAIEDFLDESELSVNFQQLSGYGGLGLMASSELLAKHQLLRTEWEYLQSAEFLHAHSQRLAESARSSGG